MKSNYIFLILLPTLAAILLPSCEKDDSDFSAYDFSNYTLRSQQGDDDDDDADISDTIALAITWNGSQVIVSGDSAAPVGSPDGIPDGVTVSTDGGDVVIISTTQRFLQLTVSGSCPDGSLLVFSDLRWGMVMNGLTLTNADGPAINNQCGKAFYITVADSTVNTLADGTSYAEITAPIASSTGTIDQKGTLFSEGQIFFSGTGALSVTGNAKNAIATDDYIVMEEGGPMLTVTANAANGIKANDGVEILGGTLTIDVTETALGGRGIKSDSYTTIAGGNITITTKADCREEQLTDGTYDYTSCAGIKSDSLFTMTAGELTITSSGDGGKGINCDQNVEFRGGTLNVKTTGTKILAKPKGVKSDTGIIVSGGSFTVQVSKSWACDNGSESGDITGMLTIEGTPKEVTYDKDYQKYVRVVY